jgi:hypothetical protein
MKKTLMIMSALVFAAGVSLSAAAPAVAAEPTTKKVCHVQHGKEVCKIVKIHKKHNKKKK